jgi:ferritin-like metal-binding protein YciE
VTSLDEQLTKYLSDTHAIEEQALVQMKMAPKIAGDPEIATAFEQHVTETAAHEQLIRERLQGRNAGPSMLKDLAGKVTGQGFALFAKFQPDTPGKLVAHAYSYEHMELAAYDLLGRVAERARDPETVAVAGRILSEERTMAERLSLLFDRAVEASLREQQTVDLDAQLNAYLKDAHALETQAIELLGKGAKIGGADELVAAFKEHLAETREHVRLIEGRLTARGASPSAAKDAALALGALNWGAFFRSQSDTPLKLTGFAYAYEHLEVAGYELLRRVAQRAGDDATETVAEHILAEKRTAAERLNELFDIAIDAALRAQEVSV